MRELQRKQRIRRAIYSFPSLIVVFAIAVLLVKGAIGIVNKERESSMRLVDLETKAVDLTQREQELRSGIEYLQTEEGIQDEIRDKFSVTQEGEYVAIIVDEKRGATTTKDEKLQWYKKIWAGIIWNK